MHTPSTLAASTAMADEYSDTRHAPCTRASALGLGRWVDLRQCANMQPACVVSVSPGRDAIDLPALRTPRAPAGDHAPQAWQVKGCKLGIFDARTAGNCLRHHPLVLIGDSVSEGLMVELLHVLHDYRARSIRAVSNRTSLASVVPLSHVMECHRRRACYAISSSSVVNVSTSALVHAEPSRQEHPLHFIRDDMFNRLLTDPAGPRIRAAAYLQALSALLSKRGHGGSDTQLAAPAWKNVTLVLSLGQHFAKQLRFACPLTHLGQMRVHPHPVDGLSRNVSSFASSVAGSARPWWSQALRKALETRGTACEDKLQGANATAHWEAVEHVLGSLRELGFRGRLVWRTLPINLGWSTQGLWVPFKRQFNDLARAAAQRSLIKLGVELLDVEAFSVSRVETFIHESTNHQWCQCGAPGKPSKERCDTPACEGHKRTSVFDNGEPNRYLAQMHLQVNCMRPHGKRGPQ